MAVDTDDINNTDAGVGFLKEDGSSGLNECYIGRDTTNPDQLKLRDIEVGKELALLELYNFYGKGVHEHLTIKESVFNSGTFELVSSFLYDGTDTHAPIIQIQSIVKSESGSTGEVRIYDITNNNVIALGMFTNAEYGLLDLGTISNLPTGPSIFEIQIRRESGAGQKKVYITALEVVH
jgi:hypothetical protein